MDLNIQLLLMLYVVYRSSIGPWKILVDYYWSKSPGDQSVATSDVESAHLLASYKEHTGLYSLGFLFEVKDFVILKWMKSEKETSDFIEIWMLYS